MGFQTILKIKNGIQHLPVISFKTKSMKKNSLACKYRPFININPNIFLPFSLKWLYTLQELKWMNKPYCKCAIKLWYQYPLTWSKPFHGPAQPLKFPQKCKNMTCTHLFFVCNFIFQSLQLYLESLKFVLLLWIQLNKLQCEDDNKLIVNNKIIHEAYQWLRRLILSNISVERQR